MWQNKKVLVTGGASFIGSHLVDRLVAKRAKVCVADDLSSGRLENLVQVKDKIEFIKGDLRDRCFADRVMQGIEVVFHLAASHGGRGYIETHPAECANNMVLDGVVIESAQRAGVERLCFASSACIYPTNLQTKGKETLYLKEDMADLFIPGKALSDGEYGWAKFMGELTLKAFYKQYGLKSCSCRIFRMDPYEIWGSGEQDRNFTYVGDIADGLIRAIEKIEDGSAVNLGRAEHTKIKDVAAEIFKVIGFKPKEIFFDTSKPEGVFSRAADLTLCRGLLDWEPQTTISEGLQKTIEWYVAIKDRAELEKGLAAALMER